MDRVTITDIRNAGHCVQGAKQWFEAHGLDFREMLREGIDEKRFLATGDALAEQVVAHKHGQA